MVVKKNGTVDFYLRAKKGNDITETKYTSPAILYKKGTKWFLFFEEISKEDKAVTKCRFEFNQTELRIRRDGHLIMDQAYKVDREITGYFKTPYGELPTKVNTHRYRVIHSEEDNVIIGLAYDLFISEDAAGKYDLKVKFFKKEETI